MKTDLEIVMQDIVTSGMAHKEDGHVDSDTGYFSVVEVPAHPSKLAQFMRNLYGASWKRELEVPSPGWYYVVEDTAGCVWVDGPAASPKYFEESFERDSADYEGETND